MLPPHPPPPGGVGIPQHHCCHLILGAVTLHPVLREAGELAEKGGAVRDIGDMGDVEDIGDGVLTVLQHCCHHSLLGADALRHIL